MRLGGILLPIVGIIRIRILHHHVGTVLPNANDENDTWAQIGEGDPETC